MNDWTSTNGRWTFRPRDNGYEGVLYRRSRFGGHENVEIPYFNNNTGLVSFSAWNRIPAYVREAVVNAMGGTGER